VLMWAAAGVMCWLVGNAAFVLAVVRCRSRARRHTAATGDRGHDDPDRRSRADAGTTGRTLRVAGPAGGGR
jgi:hypothetical protein